MIKRAVIGIGLALAPLAGAAQPAGVPSIPELEAREAKRFPQPVRVRDLIGRDVLEPKESQGLLGRVAAIRRGTDGRLELVMQFGGVLGLGARPIAVPIAATALLGQYVVVVDITNDQLASFPTAADAGAALPADETIRMAIVRPFH